MKQNYFTGYCWTKWDFPAKAGWFDQQGRAFVYYGINRIMEDLGCAHSKAEKLLSELEQAGLLRRKRQGLGKPSALYPLKFENRIS
ncbi:MAG: replication initiator protein A [Oscillibacter sp.]